VVRLATPQKNVTPSRNYLARRSNVYANVEVTLTTHDAGGLSSKDVAMATTMDDLEKRIMK
jgi:hypothetical protein